MNGSDREHLAIKGIERTNIERNITEPSEISPAMVGLDEYDDIIKFSRKFDRDD